MTNNTADSSFGQAVLSIRERSKFVIWTAKSPDFGLRPYNLLARPVHTIMEYEAVCRELFFSRFIQQLLTDAQIGVADFHRQVSRKVVHHTITKLRIRLA